MPKAHVAVVGFAIAIGGTRSVAHAQSTLHAASFPGRFITRKAIGANTAARACLALGDSTYDSAVREVGTCTAGRLTRAGDGAGRAWWYVVYSRRWLLPPADTVAEVELVLFSAAPSAGKSRPASLVPVWHYRYEPEILASVTPKIVAVRSGAALVSLDECVNGTGGCSQSFATYQAGIARPLALSFLDSLDHRFPGGIQHGFHVDVRTMRGSIGLYSANDANCCPSTIGEFTLRLRGDALELRTLELRQPPPL